MEKVVARERDLSNALFDKILASEDDYVLDQDTKDDVLELMTVISQVREKAQTRAEYKWCVDALEKWRYFLISNGEYVPFPKRVLPPFLKETRQSLPGAQEVRERQAGGGRVIEGKAVKDSYDKTAKIKVTKRKRDSLTGKPIRRSKTYLVHDEYNEVSEGDYVRAKECRPVSKTKHFVVLEVASANKVKEGSSTSV